MWKLGWFRDCFSKSRETKIAGVKLQTSSGKGKTLNGAGDQAGQTFLALLQKNQKQEPVSRTLSPEKCPFPG